MPAFSAGQRRHSVQIQKPSTGQDDAGQPDGGWTTVWKDVPAEVTFLAGGESVRGVQMQATTTHLVRMDFIAGVTSSHRLLNGDEALNINRAGDPDGTRRELLCECKQ